MTGKTGQNPRITIGGNNNSVLISVVISVLISEVCAMMINPLAQDKFTVGKLSLSEMKTG